MKQRRMTIVAVACGLACALCVGLFMLSVRNEANAARAEALARYGGEQVEVCVAARDIPAGERVEASAVETKMWLADLLPDDAISAAGDVVGKTASSDVVKGEVLSGRRFDQQHSAIDVPAGKEAVSVPAKAVQAVGGALSAGMVVDVYASGESGATVLGREVLVLDASIGTSSTLGTSSAGWVTLAVDPDRVEELVAASAKTDLYFVLPGARAQEAKSAQSSKAAAESERGEAGGNPDSSQPAPTASEAPDAQGGDGR